MKKNVLAIVFALISSASICACAPFGFGDKRAATCNQLNSKMIFNGSTSNTRASEIQNAEEPMDQRTYEKYHCDNI